MERIVVKRSLVCAAAVLAMTSVACHAALRSLGPDERNRSLGAHVGDRIEIVLGNVGPGQFESPPEISSSVLQFVDVSAVMPPNPGGVTQRFRFDAVAHGRALVRFRHNESRVVVEDTVVVR